MFAFVFRRPLHLADGNTGVSIWYLRNPNTVQYKQSVIEWQRHITEWLKQMQSKADWHENYFRLEQPLAAIVIRAASFGAAVY